MLSAFFPNICEDLGVKSPTMNGLIFTAYPIGLTIMSIYSPKLNIRFGTKQSSFFGLFTAAIFNLLFGFIPDILPLHLNQYGFLICYFMNGFLGGLAGTGCSLVLTEMNPDRKGVIAAAIGTASGLGCMAGPPLGGLLYDLGGGNSYWGFRFPFVLFSVLLLAAAFLVLYVFPEDLLQEEEDESVLPMTSVLNVKNSTALLGIAANGAFVATLDPTLAYRLSAPPLYYGAAAVGSVFMASSITYTLTSIPIGWVPDEVEQKYSSWQYVSQVCKIIQAVGLFFLGVAFTMLGPAFGAGFLFDNQISVWIAMIIKGIGSAGNNSGYPDLVCDNRDDAAYNATICGLWNASYAFGWAVGPVLGGGLYDLFGFAGFSTIMALANFLGAFGLAISALPSWDFYHKQPTYLYTPVDDFRSEHAKLLEATVLEYDSKPSQETCG